jgi:hypothetical protein
MGSESLQSYPLHWSFIVRKSLMEIVNLIIAIASLVVAAVAGIYIPLRLHRDSHKPDKDH